MDQYDNNAIPGIPVELNAAFGFILADKDRDLYHQHYQLYKVATGHLQIQIVFADMFVIVYPGNRIRHLFRSLRKPDAHRLEPRLLIRSCFIITINTVLLIIKLADEV